MSNNVSTSTPPQGICRLDLFETDATAFSGKASKKRALASHAYGSHGSQFWYPDTRHFTNEPIVVPKKRSTKAQNGTDSSDQVYVLTTVEDASSGRAYLAILDGENVAQGPLAKIWLRYLPHQIHGWFIEETYGLFE